MKVTSFADVADLRAYNNALDQGKTPQEALAVGDNGVGAWGKSTVAGTGPCFATSHEDGAGRGKFATLYVEGKNVLAECRDIGPPGVIDLNPDACSALGLTPPVLTSGSLSWRVKSS